MTDKKSNFAAAGLICGQTVTSTVISASVGGPYRVECQTVAVGRPRPTPPSAPPCTCSRERAR